MKEKANTFMEIVTLPEELTKEYFVNFKTLQRFLIGKSFNIKVAY